MGRQWKGSEESRILRVKRPECQENVLLDIFNPGPGCRVGKRTKAKGKRSGAWKDKETGFVVVLLSFFNIWHSQKVNDI